MKLLFMTLLDSQTTTMENTMENTKLNYTHYLSSPLEAKEMYSLAGWILGSIDTYFEEIAPEENMVFSRSPEIVRDSLIDCLQYLEREKRFTSVTRI